jgi:lipopolysaccharide transport protein LptA
MKRIFFSFLILLSLCSSSFGLSKKINENILIKADLFELDGKLNLIIASGNVLVKQRDVNLYSKKAYYYQDKQIIHLTDSVKVIKDKMLLTCKEAKANGHKNILTAIGNVVFSFDKIRGKSSKAVYNFKKEKITLTGNPQAWRGLDSITGKIIDINMKNKKITTKGEAEVIISEDTLKNK